MKEDLHLTVIILTYNEEIHIERCINSIKGIATEIFLIDSYSTDKTVEIAERLGAVVLQNKWPNNHAAQLKWGLENAPIKTEWILRLDADELLTENLTAEIKLKLPDLHSPVNGVVLPRFNYFMGRKITKGTGAVDILRLFRRNKAVCENQLMDEQMVLLEGESVKFQNYMVDHNLNNLSWWTDKHNNYSTREMIQLLSQEVELGSTLNHSGTLSPDAEKKRKLKSTYSKMPLFWRAAAYFIYRYIFKGGFLEGKEGFLWHFLQGFWYRVLIDAKIYEIRKACGNDPAKIKKYISHYYKIDL